jgi:hypothetical protein
MSIKRNWGIVHDSVLTLAFTLALAAADVAGAATPSSLAGDTPTPQASQTADAGQNGRTLETYMKWRSNSFSVAGSRNWSKLIVFTSTSINVRLPIN